MTWLYRQSQVRNGWRIKMIMWLRFKIAVALFDLGILVGPEFSSDEQYNRLYKLLKNTHTRVNEGL
jgi:hypothetical protein